MEQQIHFCTTSDDVRIAYAVTGDGYPLVWVPGWLSHAEIDWDVPVLGDRYRALTKDFTLYRLDKRGTGLSARRLKEYSRAAWVLDVEAVVADAGLERFALAGYSEGGPIAVEYATLHPDKVSHLILMGTGVVSPGENPEMVEMIQALVTIIRTHWGTAVKMMTDFFFGEDASPEAQKSFADYQKQSADAVDAAAMLAEAPATYQIADLAPKVQVPTLLIHGRSDQAIPIELGQRLASLIPHAAFKSIEGHHVPNPKQSAQMVAAIREFVLGSAAPSTEPARPSATADTHTILFTDMESSTALTERLGDAGAQEVRRTHNDIVRTALDANGGSEIKHTGDGIMASFSAASSALGCAIAIQRGVAEHKEEHPDSPLAVYIGVNAGEPIAEDDDLFGTSINLAARICDRAEPGQILAADVIRQLTAGKQFLFSDLGETELRGFEDPVRLYEVRWRE
ncbi:MAG: adenylate/guanylate cyclase domain-containing protein [Chloroflexi bacterium]|nr:adenylate/guanylate cyclase domain-containing protein [Chloroflexota bacterium]